jgi:hypothetical protein
VLPAGGRLRGGRNGRAFGSRCGIVLIDARRRSEKCSLWKKRAKNFHPVGCALSWQKFFASFLQKKQAALLVQQGQALHAEMAEWNVLADDGLKAADMQGVAAAARSALAL